MMQQPYIGATEPVNPSLAACQEVQEKAPNYREQVFQALLAAGVHGLTDEEVTFQTGIVGNTVNPRMNELVVEGRVVDSSYRRPTGTGSMATVWVVNPDWVEPTQSLKPMPGGVDPGLVNIWTAIPSCTGCELSGKFGPCVPGFASRPPLDIQLMAVAEAPGREESERGIPMWGNAGKEFNRLLLLADIERSQTIITNVVKQRPSASNATPSQEIIDACSQRWLRRELMVAQPKVVLAVGAVAIAWFLPDYGSVGMAHRIPRYVEIPGVWSGTVFPVYHTAAGLHNPGLSFEIEEDFRALGDLLKGTLSVKTPAPPDTSGYYETWDTHQTAEIIRKAGIVAIDTESDEDGFWGASFSTKPGEGIVITKGANFDPISRILETGEITIIMHNAYYDLQILAEAGIQLDTTLLFDTMVAAYLCGESSQGLKQLVYRKLSVVMTRYEDLIAHYGAPRAIAYLHEALDKEYPRTRPVDVLKWDKEPWTKAQKEADLEGWAARPKMPIWKTERSKPVHTRIEALIKDIETKEDDPFDRWKNWTDFLKEWIVERVGRPFPRPGISDVPDRTVAVNYSAGDADLTLQLWPEMLLRMQQLGVDKAYFDIEAGTTPILADMTMDGIGVNLEYVKELQVEYTERIQQNLNSTWAYAGHNFLPGSNPQVLWILDKFDIIPTKKTKTGTSTDDTALEPFQDHPIVKGILEHRRLEKLKSTYIDNYLELGEDRIHTTWKQTRTRTYRVASSDPNLQNVAKRGEGKRLRRAFEAKPGYLLYAADFSQIEMRWMAWDAQAKGMIEAFLRGDDIHGNTMWDMWELTEENTDHDYYEEMRTIAKGLNFGIIFGIAAQGFAKQNRKIGNTDDERLKKSQSYIDGWFQARPEVKAKMEARKLQVIADGFVRDAFGRYRWVPGAKSNKRSERESALREAINMPIQGGAAGQMKLALIAVSSGLKAAGLRARILLQEHDEMVLEVPVEEVQATHELVTAAMADCYQLGIPTPVKSEIGPNWGDMHPFEEMVAVG